ncbi:MAG: glycosyltransferase family 2 protein [Bacteroidales bacterium]|nr:glycosyltransferase family 2 protein [Bacteroidales bacterium]MDT8432999.1 glycosyltransferase family 2 protein [Bacteroidales bacterium]
MSGLAIAAFVILLVRLLIVLINMYHRQWLKEVDLSGEPLVSVLIPARNEELNLPLILADLETHDYRNIEVVVYDDLSEDGTLAIARSFADRDSRFSVLEGLELPAGWLGKNHACHRLSLQARGDYLLFLDADVRIRHGLIRRSLGHMMQYDLLLLSLFPRQKMHTLGELLTVPAMNLILLSLLPMRLIRLSHRPSLAAANGQFMLFEANTYRAQRYHERVRELNVEDMAIIKLMKVQRLKVHTMLSSGEVECRMYRGYSEAIGGMTRSVFAFFGGSGLVLLLFTVFTTFGFLFVWLGLSLQWMVLYLTLTWLMRMLVAAMSRQPLFWNVVLQPVQQASFVVLVAEAFRRRFRARNIWKGREIKFCG